MSIPTIPQFFSGKRIFVTGATGFMGKVLVEKLLRSCNDLETVYVLVRGKKGKSAAERWAESAAQPCFDVLRKEYPTALNTKVKVLKGDVREEKLGLSTADYDLLVKTVDIIFHVAASVRFNDPLADAIRMNTYGTLQVVQLAAKIPNLLVLMHVSTAYCYCNKLREIDEKIYPVDMDWREAIKISENIDNDVLTVLSQKFTDYAPNTYVYSKSLAEQVINDHRHIIPAVILRPSIVISSWKEPIPGWIDNFNGPIGLVVAAGKGVIRICLCNPDAVPDYMAVDVSIKAMIIAAWKTGVARDQKPLGGIEVYNSSSTSSKSISNRELIGLSQTVIKETPIEEVLWYPSWSCTKNVSTYRFFAFFSHFLFALAADALLRGLRLKPRLLKIHVKIHIATMALSYFLTREWTFKNSRFRALNDAVLFEDRDSFDFNFDDLDPLEYFRIASKGAKQYLLHEDIHNIEVAKRKERRLWFADKAIKYLLLCLLAYYVLMKLIASVSYN